VVAAEVAAGAAVEGGAVVAVPQRARPAACQKVQFTMLVLVREMLRLKSLALTCLRNPKEACTRT